MMYYQQGNIKPVSLQGTLGISQSLYFWKWKQIQLTQEACQIILQWGQADIPRTTPLVLFLSHLLSFSSAPHPVLKIIITPLLRYNSQTIQFTHFKYTVSGFQYIHRVLQLSPWYNFRVFSWPPKAALYLLGITPALNSPFQPSPKQQPLIYFLSEWICLSWIFHTHEMIQYVVLCAWLLSLIKMFSRFIHIVAWINTSLLFLVSE